MKFSIIIPVFNVAEYLSQCLDSVLAQTCEDWECVCVDDGSTDGSSEILDEYARNDSRIKVVHQLNSGVAAARNAALDIIKGDWFLFLDSDDAWSPNLLEICEAGMRFDPDAKILSFEDVHFPATGKMSWTTVDATVVKFYQKDMTGPFSRRWMGFMAQKKTYLRACFGDLREREYSVGEDLVYMTQCALRINRMLCVDIPLYGYRDRPTSVTRTRVTKQKTLDHIKATQETIQLLQNSGRTISRRTCKELCNVLTEDVGEEIGLLTKGERNGIIPLWEEALTFLKSSSIPYNMQRLRLTILLSVKAWKIRSLLTVLPRKLKEKGFHR